MSVYILSVQGSWAHRPLHSCTLHGRPGTVLATSLYKAGAYADHLGAWHSISDVRRAFGEPYDAECPYLFPRGVQCEKARDLLGSHIQTVSTLGAREDDQ